MKPGVLGLATWSFLAEPGPGSSISARLRVSSLEMTEVTLQRGPCCASGLPQTWGPSPLNFCPPLWSVAKAIHRLHMVPLQLFRKLWRGWCTSWGPAWRMEAALGISARRNGTRDCVYRCWES